MKNIYLNWTIALLSGIFVLFIMSTVGFIFGFSINGLYSIAAVTLSFYLLVYLSIKNGFDKKSIIAQCIALFDFCLCAGIICYFIPDFSYDGITYEDMRIAGFGYFFSGILLLACGLCVYYRFKNKNDKKMFWQ